MPETVFGPPEIDCDESSCRLAVPIRTAHWLPFVASFSRYAGTDDCCLVADVVIVLDGATRRLSLTVPADTSRAVSAALLYAHLMEIGHAMSDMPDSEVYGEALSAMASPRFSFLLDGLRLRRTADDRVNIGIS